MPFHFHIPNITNYDASYYFSDRVEEAKSYLSHVNDKLEFYILLEGDISFLVESSLYKLTPGDVIVTRPNETHNCIINSCSVHKHICIWFEPECEFLFSDFLVHDFGKNNHIVPDSKSKKRLFEICDSLKAASDKKDTHAEFILTLEMLSIFRKSLSSGESCEKLLPETLKSILADIDENYKIIQSLTYFENKYYISASTLNRMFNKYLRTTPKNYIEAKKLTNSRKLLKEGNGVLFASMESGFLDYSNYIRLFKKRFGITPRQYRDEEKELRSIDVVKKSKENK